VNARLRLRAALCVIVAVAALGGTAAVSAGRGVVDQPTRPAERRRAHTPTLVIGDSAMAALVWAPLARQAVVAFDVTLDLEACRRLYRPSCASPAPTTAYEALGVHGPGFDTLVVAVGYNDLAAFTAEGFEAVVDRARQLGYSRIVWFTLRGGGSFSDRNAVVRQLLASGRFPEVVLADWEAYTSTHPDWFVSDRVHFRVTGAWAAADYLTRKLAYLDERICPVPFSPNQPSPDPCPDPDATGPIADLQALYPIVGA
jgi:hypothetical protein